MSLTDDQKIIDAVIKKAWKDPAFKDDLINNPEVTIETFLGREINLPQGKKLAFVDQTDDSIIYINIPAEPNFEDMELDENQLDAVSGGTDIDPPIVVKPNNYDGTVFGN